jgi:hypothetical protein
MEVVAHHRIGVHGNGEDCREFDDLIFEPLLAVIE